ncbi:NAD-dependent epimerase/dehydratase [Hylemonella gracilis ATCC 19624]|uniref:NAD-dependent epimerase/dehydratase n=1 Tax=Hylemonella gracilis ATCC 19624 TaxID=887062 RepID=F3KTR2_9BURK|nr:NAD-dependent epimerase/dehydratase [Hylemonella gracilis ATCC 19624]
MAGAGFAALDMPASSAWTRGQLGWVPTGVGLMGDLAGADYFGE